MAAITICNDFGAQKNKVNHVSPSICHVVDQRPWSWSRFVFIISFGLGVSCLFGCLLVFCFPCFFLLLLLFFYWFVFWLLGFVFITCWRLYFSVIFFLHLSQFCYYLPWALFVWFFSFFAMPHGLWGHGSQAAGQKLLWWKLQVQASRPPEISREY